jgi:NADH-quinone oxidoreductase subunit M
MTVFMGSWEKADAIYRIATILACASIVVTAVYILRATGSVIMGPLKVPADASGMTTAPVFKVDATWNEKLAAGVLIVGILIIGITPFLLTELIKPGTETIMNKLLTLGR